LDGQQRSALAVVRSLGRRGHHLTTADIESAHLAGHSRYTESATSYPNPRTDLSAFKRWLQSAAREHDAVLPMTDVTMPVALGMRMELACHLPFSDLEGYEFLSDKFELFRFAADNDIHIPRTKFVDEPDELNVDTIDLDFPVYVKPDRSVRIEGDHFVETSVLYVRNREELRATLASVPWLRNGRLVIQEQVSGFGVGLFVHADEGEIRNVFAHRRKREKPPSGGVSVLSESVPAPPYLVECATRLLARSRWTGICMVEFKGSGTRPALMEVNARPWGSMQLAIDSGVDFAALLIAPDDEVSEYRTGRQLRWLLGDLDHLYLLWKSASWPSDTGRFVVAALRFLLPWKPRRRFEVMRLDDLQPFLFELKRYIA